MSGPEEYPEGYGGSFVQHGYAPTPPPNVTYGSQPKEEDHSDDDVANIEAEASLLGGMMIANQMIPLIEEKLTADDFFEPMHGRIYKAIIKLHERGKVANPISLRPIFQRDPDMKELGGVSYLAQLTGSGAAIIGMVDFAEQIAELAARRTIVDAARSAIVKLTDPGAEGIDAGEIDDVMADLQDAAFKATTRATPMKPRTSSDLIRRVIERQGEVDTSGETPGARCKSIEDINTLLGRVEGKTVNIIGGRPGMGKTAVAATMAWGYAANGVPVEFYHGEMSEDQMAMRHASDLSHAMGCPLLHKMIREGKLTPEAIRQLEQVDQVAELLPLNFVATGPCNIKRIEAAAGRAAVRWQARGKKLGGIFVDYLQLFGADDVRGRPLQPGSTECVTAVSKSLVRVAHRLNIFVFALCALGRQVEERKDHRPQMSDLKQSGDIEQDADSVTLVFRPEVYLVKEKPKADPQSKEFKDWELEWMAVRDRAELICEKNRHGKARTRTVRFHGQYYAVRGSNEDEEGRLLSPTMFEDEEEEVF